MLPLINSWIQLMARWGIHEFCVAAGSRNAPLIDAIHQWQKHEPSIQIWNFFDERAAAFFAVGRLLNGSAPIAVLTTSGTAAAELLPACIESYYQGLPLLLITADRPIAFRDSGAPQAINQLHLFGQYVSHCIDASSADDLPNSLPCPSSQPMHLNLCLGEAVKIHLEPPSLQSYSKHWLTEWLRQPVVSQTDYYQLTNQDTILLVAGLTLEETNLIYSDLLRFNLPIYHEATVQFSLLAQQTLKLISASEVILSKSNAKNVIRIGAVPSWRFWRDLESQPHIAVYNLSRAGLRGLGRTQNVTVIKSLSQIQTSSSDIKNTFDLKTTLLSLCDSLPLSEVGWLNQLNKIIPLPAALFLGNSLPIREWNLVHQNSVRPCFANRGANGIDGLWSTYYGLSTHFTESWLILGDLSALYDLSAPWIVAQLPANQRRRIVVINNQGGQIFERIQSLNHLPHQTKKVIINSHQHSFKNIAAHWNLQYLQPSNITELHHLPETDVLIEIQPQAQQSKLFWQNHQTLAN